jgi:hypothetical protein
MLLIAYSRIISSSTLWLKIYSIALSTLLSYINYILIDTVFYKENRAASTLKPIEDIYSIYS